MDFERTYRKRLRVNRALANEFKSCRQFINGDSELSALDNDRLRTVVLNRAIQYSLKQEYGLLNILVGLSDGSRVNGANLEIDIEAENWAELGDIITKIKSWKGLTEFDLIEYILGVYMKEVKLKGGELP